MKKIELDGPARACAAFGRIGFAVGLAVLVQLSWVLPASAAGRVALVIGNGAYTGTSTLSNPVNDARDIGQALRRLGFEVLSALNASRESMLDALGDLEERSVGADMVAVFYAGHGMELGGENYLIPVDARLASDTAVRRETVSLDTVLDATAAARVRVVILDACRNNPFARSMRMLSSRRQQVSPGGLAPVGPGAGGGLLVAYAAAAGSTALDGTGERNSPYTRALLRHVETPGVELRVMFGNVGGEVATEVATTTNDDEQQPFIYTSLTGEHYLSGLSGAGPAATVAADASVPARLQQENLFWQSIAGSTEPADFEAYLRRYPNGAFRELAENRLGELTDPPRPPAGTAIRDCPTCPELVVLPAGTFRMGSDQADAERAPNEQPPRTVRIGQFAAGRHEVTVREYAAFVDATSRATTDGCLLLDAAGSASVNEPRASWRNPGFAQDAGEPVVCVSWADAGAYVAWLSARTGARYRLPSEAEWEYAARAGTTTARYPARPARLQHRHAQQRSGRRRFGRPSGGGDDAASQCRELRRRSGGATSVLCTDGATRTARAGSLAANRFGLHDMLGNASEWVADCWHDDYNGAPNDGRARLRGGESCLRVIRGGSWAAAPGDIRAAARDRDFAGLRSNRVGFRVVREVD